MLVKNIHKYPTYGAFGACGIVSIIEHGSYAAGKPARLRQPMRLPMGRAALIVRGGRVAQHEHGRAGFGYCCNNIKFMVCNGMC